MRPDEPQSPAQGAGTQHGAAGDASMRAQQDAAANIVRSQLDNIYDPSAAPKVETEDNTNPYNQSHTKNPQPSQEQWAHYHSSWQNYYKTYYERYYTQHVHQARQAIAASQPQSQPQVAAAADAGVVDKDTAVLELRNRLVGNVQEAAVKVKKSRHFIPIMAAICVMLLFLFLQYNRIIFANVEAYVTPGNVEPQNIIVDPTTSTKVDPSSTQLMIPKINVDAPVDYSATPDHDSQMEAMVHGLAYFGIPGANSKPGQIGNTPIAGHSSNDVLAPGNYKFIFAQLHKLKKGDTIYANYKGTRYTYIVTKKEVVTPDKVGKLVYQTDKPVMTLITCTPLGTALKRLLVTAEQVSPSPTKAAPPPQETTAPAESDAKMPGVTPTIFEAILGLF